MWLVSDSLSDVASPCLRLFVIVTISDTGDTYEFAILNSHCVSRYVVFYIGYIHNSELSLCLQSVLAQQSEDGGGYRKWGIGRDGH